MEARRGEDVTSGTRRSLSSSRLRRRHFQTWLPAVRNRHSDALSGMPGSCILCFLHATDIFPAAPVTPNTVVQARFPLTALNKPVAVIRRLEWESLMMRKLMGLSPAL